MIFFLCYFGFILVLDLIFLINDLFIKNYVSGDETLVSVSILVPARNESGTIKQTLQSLQLQDFPKEKKEILVGDDNSTDNTGDIVKSICELDSTITYYRIEPEMKSIGGKAGVLDYLIKKSKGEIIVIADADMTYPDSWLQKICRITFGEQKLISGFTRVEGDRMWARLQNLDWLLNLSGVRILDNLNFKLTAIGNNMAFPKKAYDQLPGFSQMKNFITEDMELLRQMQTASFGSRLIFSREILGRTKPMDSWRLLIRQRQRWMTGAMKAPFWLILTWFLRIMFVPLLAIFAIMNPIWAGWILFVHISLLTFGLYIVFRKLSLTFSLSAAVLFEFFYFISNSASLLYYIFKKEIIWKEKTYDLSTR